MIGGSSLYEKALTDYLHLCKLVINTRINKDFEADVMMPEVPKDKFRPVFISQTYSQIKDGITFDFMVQANAELMKANPELLPTRMMQWYPRHPEMQYLDCIREVIKTGASKDDRTGTGVFSNFGY